MPRGESAPGSRPFRLALSPDRRFGVAFTGGLVHIILRLSGEEAGKTEQAGVAQG